MGKFVRMASIVLAACIAMGFGMWTAPVTAEAGPLVIDKETGHYKDLSYEALTDEGLSWEERTQLFGGQTVHYAELTPKQHQAKQLELNSLLDKIDTKLVKQCEADIRKWLDQQAKDLPPAYSGRDTNKIRCGAVVFFRAYEIFGDKKYLDAGLARANLILKAQWPKGHWPWGTLGENFVRIQDGYNDRPFWVMLYAYKVTGDKKYFESAKRCADVLLSLQRPGGGWGDQWSFSGRGSGHTGVVHGISFNDNPTNSSFEIMVTMYHMIGDKKYIANLGKLKAFIAKAKLGEGNVVGWAAQYHDDGRPARARGYEIELPYPGALTRGVGPLLIDLYLITGDEENMELLKKGYAWCEYARKQDMKPETWKYWKILNDSWKKRGTGWHYRPGWPDAWLPDGSNCGHIRKKYGGFVGMAGADTEAAKIGMLRVWAKDADKNYGRAIVHASNGNSMVQLRRALMEHKRGGHKGLLKYYTNPTKYSSDQYLQARVDAAKRALDKRNVKLASNPDKKGILTRDPAGLMRDKGRWYGAKHSKWGIGNYEFLQETSGGKWGSVAWYQWQLVYDAMLAQGKIDADAAARGGRGLETVAWSTHLDSFDALGEWGMACHEMENHFDVPIGKK